jgi:hypothetical protein
MEGIDGEPHTYSFLSVNNPYSAIHPVSAIRSPGHPEAAAAVAVSGVRSGGDIYRFPPHKNRGNRATLRIAAIAATTGTPATAVTTGIVAMAVTRSLEPR